MKQLWQRTDLWLPGFGVGGRYKGTFVGEGNETILYPDYSGGYTNLYKLSHSTVYAKKQSQFYSVNLESKVFKR